VHPQVLFQRRQLCRSSSAASKNDASDDSSDATAHRDDQRRQQPDYFHMFNMPRRYEIDMGLLKLEYHNRMKQLHPDTNCVRRNRMRDDEGTSSTAATAAVVDGADDDEDKESVEEVPDASQITNAYDTLTKPHLRARHLLALLGRPVDSDDPDSAGEKTNGLLDGEFLMGVFQVQEEIGGARCDEERKPLQLRNRDRIVDTGAALQDALDRDDLDAARVLAAQLQYWNRIEETLRKDMDRVE
jgi:molecular chaperone HscB